jgi:hypothetical protein
MRKAKRRRTVAAPASPAEAVVAPQPQSSAVAAPQTQSSPLLRPDVFLPVAQLLSANEQALCLRPVCKDAREQLRGATTVMLSQPVPTFAFAEKWGRREVYKSMAYWHRHELMCLTAKSGVTANLRLLAVGPASPSEPGVASCALTQDVFTAAAGAGQLEMCKLLHELACPWLNSVYQVAGRAGHMAVVRWLIDTGYPRDAATTLEVISAGGSEAIFELLVHEGFAWSPLAAGAAAAYGHSALVRRLLQLSEQNPRRKPTDVAILLRGAAMGLSCAEFQASGQRGRSGWVRRSCRRQTTAWAKAPLDTWLPPAATGHSRALGRQVHDARGGPPLASREGDGGGRAEPHGGLPGQGAAVGLSGSERCQIRQGWRISARGYGLQPDPGLPASASHALRLPSSRASAALPASRWTGCRRTATSLASCGTRSRPWRHGRRPRRK